MENSESRMMTVLDSSHNLIVNVIRSTRAGGGGRDRMGAIP